MFKTIPFAYGSRSRTSPRAYEGCFRAEPGASGVSPVRAAFFLSLPALLSLTGCALETRPGDGLVSDGIEIQLSPVTPADSGSPSLPPAATGGALPPCKSVALFQEKVVPHFIEKCLECHDGTKGKAAIALPMVVLKQDPATTCALTLLLSVKTADKSQADLLTSSDPSRPDKVHDFKYEQVADFERYRADVLAWLDAEK